MFFATQCVYGIVQLNKKHYVIDRLKDAILVTKVVLDTKELTFFKNGKHINTQQSV